MATITGTQAVKSVLNGLVGQLASIRVEAGGLEEIGQEALKDVNWRLSRSTPEPLQGGNIAKYLSDANAKIASLETKIASLKSQLAGLDLTTLANTPDPS